jgi:hypothetical protein
VLLSRIQQLVAAMEGVTSVSANPETGSIVVHYHLRHNPDHFVQRLQQQGESSGALELVPPEVGQAGELYRELTQEAEFLAAHSELARATVQALRNLDNAVKRATNNNLDLKVLVPLCLAIYSALEFGAEISTPLWVTLGIFSFNSFVALHPPLPYPRTENLVFPEKHAAAPGSSGI